MSIFFIFELEKKNLNFFERSEKPLHACEMPKHIKRVGLYKRCCQSIVLHIKDELEQEKKRNRLTIGVQHVWERIIKYTGMSRSTLAKMISEELPPEEYTMTKNRPLLMPREDENRLRPAIIDMVSKEKYISIDSLMKHLNEENGGWEWSRSATLQALKRIRVGFGHNRHGYL